MKIKTLVVSGVKTHDGKAYDFGDLTLVTGPNGSGKTAILDSIKLLLLGYHPVIGRQPGKISQISPDSQFSVTAELEDGGRTFTVSRSWKRTGQTWKMAQKGCPTVDGLVFDFDSWLTATKSDRVNAIAQLSAGNGTAVAGNQAIADAVEAIGSEPVIRERPPLELPGPQFLAEWIEAAKRKLGEAKANRNSFQGIVNSLGDLQATDDPINVGDVRLKVAENSKKQAGVRNEIDLATAELSKAELALALHDSVYAKAQGIREVVSVEAAEARVQELETELEVLGREQVEFDTKNASLEADAAFLRREMQRLTSQLQKLNKEYNALQTDPEQVCPTCGTPGGTWVQKRIKELRALANDLNAESEVVDNQETKCKIDLEAIQATRAHLRANARVLEDALQGAKNELANAKAQAEVLAASKDLPDRDRLLADKATAEGKVATLREVLQKLQVAAQGLDVTLREVEARANDSKRRKQALEAVTKAEADLVTIQSAIALLEAEKSKVAEAGAESLFTASAELVRRMTGKTMFHEDGELGLIDEEGRRIPFSCLSGTETLIASTAMCLAFAKTGSCRIVLMDELGRLDEQRQKTLISEVQKMLGAGAIDQFIGAATSVLPEICVTTHNINLL